MCELGENSPKETVRNTTSASAASTSRKFLSVLPVFMARPSV